LTAPLHIKYKCVGIHTAATKTWSPVGVEKLRR